MSRAELFLQAFRRFTYVIAHSPTLPSLYLQFILQPLCSFSKLSVASLTSQLILQPFRCFTYITAHSPTLPLLHLHHSSFSNPSFASPSQALHLHHLRAAHDVGWFLSVKCGHHKECVLTAGLTNVILRLIFNLTLRHVKTSVLYLFVHRDP